MGIIPIDFTVVQRVLRYRGGMAGKEDDKKARAQPIEAWSKGKIGNKDGIQPLRISILNA